MYTQDEQESIRIAQERKAARLRALGYFEDPNQCMLDHLFELVAIRDEFNQVYQDALRASSARQEAAR